MEAFLAKLSDPTILVGILVLFGIVAVIFLRKRGLKKIGIGPGGASVETHSPADVTSVRNIQAAGTDVTLAAKGKGASIDGVKIDPASKNIDINSSTQ